MRDAPRQWVHGEMSPPNERADQRQAQPSPRASLARPLPGGQSGAVPPPFVLVHSPLVGPSTWSGVASELRHRGHRVVVPSLVESATTGRWQDCVKEVVDACSDLGACALIGHSGAGPLLPVIACRLDEPPQCCVFVDAGVPPPAGTGALVPDEFRDQLQAIAIDGRLPKWSEWFGRGAMSALVPDIAMREAIVAELPQLPMSYFEQHVPIPPRWARLRCAYILLSEAYRSDGEEARFRGWPTTEMIGAHLDIVTRPEELTDALLRSVG
jgi:hypothetical protein